MTKYIVSFTDSDYVCRVKAEDKCKAVFKAVMLKIRRDCGGEYWYVIDLHLHNLIRANATFEEMFLEAWKLGVHIFSVEKL